MSRKTYADWFEVEVAGQLVEALFSFTVTPFVPATYWQPAEGGEIDFVSHT